MPIYEYKCGKCKKLFEYLQKFSDDPKEECEECEGNLTKVLSTSSFSLKGSGWYKDGYTLLVLTHKTLSSSPEHIRVYPLRSGYPRIFHLFVKSF